MVIQNRIKVFQRKKLILLATAPGPRGGLSVLETADERFPRHGATILGAFLLPKFQENFDVVNQQFLTEEWNEKFNIFIKNVQTNF